MTRKYGTVRFAPPGGYWTRGAWLIDCEPHVAEKLKRWFRQLDANEDGTLILTATREASKELLWIFDLFPMTVAAADLQRMEMLRTEYDEAQVIVQRILSGERLAGGAWLEPAVTPYDFQLEAADIAMALGRLLIMDETGLGKAQPLDAQVLTPGGFRAMGDIRVDDEVVAAADGRPCRVTAVYPQGEQDCYRVTFSDGAIVECNSEHLWRVRSFRRTRSKVDGEWNARHWSTRTLADLLKAGLYRATGGPKWHVPMATPADLDAGGVRPLDPYLLGVLLGDGCFRGGTPTFSSVDDEIVEAVTRLVPANVIVKNGTRPCDYRLVRIHRRPTCLRCDRVAKSRRLCGRCYQAAAKVGALPERQRQRPHPIITALTSLELWGHTSLQKFVPDAYKLAPASDRLALLQGLMDTDGYAMSLPAGNASAFFYSSSERLADDVAWLVESLGGTVRRSSKVSAGRERFTVTVKLPASVNPFRLARKAERWGQGHETFQPTRAIVKVEQVGRKPMQCIAIDHPEHLYVTDRFVATHNTFTSYLTLRDPDNLPALVVCDSHMQLQWLRQLGKFLPMLRGHIVRKREVYDPSQMRDMRGHHPDVLITNYAKIDAWAQHLRGNVQTIILDEVQALRTGGKTGKYTGCAMIAATAKLVVGATASPVYNYGGEAHHILQIIERDCLGTREEFIRAWGKKMNGGKVGVRDPRALGTHLRDKGLVIRRTRKDVKKELPAVIRIPHEVDVDERTFDEELARSGAFAVADLILSGAGERKEVFKARGDIDWQMRRATGLAKASYVAAFAELVLESERKIVLAGWHRDVYDIWKEQLRRFRPVLYTGSESAVGKDRNAQRFIDDPDVRVLMMSLRSGQGIDGLQGACRVVLFGELDWSPTMHKQLIDRLNRDGMDHSEPVLAYFLTCDFGSDPFVMETLGIKRGQAEPLVDPEVALFSQVAPDARDRVRLLAEAAIARRRATRRALSRD